MRMAKAGDPPAGREVQVALPSSSNAYTPSPRSKETGIFVKKGGKYMFSVSMVFMV